MKRYNVLIDELYDDKRPCKKDKIKDKNRRKDKKMKRAMQTKDIDELMSLEDEY